MELKESASVVLGITLILLFLGFLTGGLVFYGSAVILSLFIAFEYYRLTSLKHALEKSLAVKRGFSMSEIYIGSPTQLICRLNYEGGSMVRLKVTQDLDDVLGGNGDWAPVELSPGSSVYLKTILSPSGTGTFAIAPLDVGFGTWLFNDSIRTGKELSLSVYVSIDASIRRSGISGLRAKKEAGIFDSTIAARGKGIDFLSIRRYVGGDSMKRVDWIRSSRMSDLMVREYEDEQPVPIFFIIDLDPSMGEGDGDTGLRSAIGLTSAIINKAMPNGERIGFNGFSRTDAVSFIRPAMGPEHMFRMRNLLSSLKTVDGPVIMDRHDQDALPYDVLKAIGHDVTLNAFIGDALNSHMANIKDDGFSRAMTGALRSLNTVSRIVIITNLSMGKASLLNATRIARYYGHRVSVVFIPHVWHEDPEAIEAEAKGVLTTLRSNGLEAVAMYPGETPEDVIRRGGIIGLRAAI